MNNTEIKEIGKRFQLARKYCKLSQSEIAKEVGTSIEVIKNLELGRTKTLNMPVINLFCTKHNININWILENQGKIYKETSTIDKLVKEYGFSLLEETMLKNYTKLSEDERKVFTKYFMSLSSITNQIDVNELGNNVEKVEYTHNDDVDEKIND